MNDTMLNVKFVEVVIMEVLVFAAFAAILIAAVCDMVKAKVRESRRKDEIASQPVQLAPRMRRHIVRKPIMPKPFAHGHLRT